MDIIDSARARTVFVSRETAVEIERQRPVQISAESQGIQGPRGPVGPPGEGGLPAEFGDLISYPENYYLTERGDV